MRKLAKPTEPGKVVDTAGQDLGPSSEFMLEDLARSGLTPADIRVEPLPLEPDGTRSYKILYPKGGVYRIRRDGTPKYAGPAGVNDAFMVEPGDYTAMLQAPTIDVVEGEKKAAAYRKYTGKPCVGTGGCWNFRTKELPPDEMIHELASLVKVAGHTRLFLDGDIVDNDDVARAARQYYACCEKLGARCEIVQLPHDTDGRRLGMDDWVLSTGLKGAQLRAAIDELPRIDPLTLPESRKLIAHRLKLSMRKMGEAEIVAPTYENAVKIVGSMLEGRATTDEFLGETIDGRPYSDEDDTGIQQAIEGLLGAINPWPIELTRTARRFVMARNQSNKLSEWLQGLKWDKKPRIDTLFRRLFGSEDHTDEYLADAALAFLGGMVHRAIEPGCKFDLMLILQGPQGIGKTVAFEALAGTLNGRRLVSTADLGADPNELGRIMGQSWIVSFDEMAGHSRRDDAMLKNLLTMTERVQNEKYREKLRRSLTHNVFAGTTNEWQPLRDVTGNRRFLVVRCGRIDVKEITREREQLMAEAVARTAKGSWWDVRGASEEQEAARMAHPWEEKLDHYLATAPMMRGAKGTTYETRRLTTAAALAAAVRASTSGDTRPVELNAAVLARSVFARGWVKARIRREALDFGSHQPSLFYPPTTSADGSTEVVIPSLVWVYVDPKPVAKRKG